MPPRRYSRYAFTLGVSTDDGKLMLTERIPFRYRPLDDTIEVFVRDGDTLWGIANRAYAGLPRPAGLWWVIADFQPEPIVDPTIRLTPGQRLYVPSLRVVEEEIMGIDRRNEVET
jgi:nucleoid-associated protein YgaU